MWDSIIKLLVELGVFALKEFNASNETKKKFIEFVSRTLKAPSQSASLKTTYDQMLKDLDMQDTPDAKS